MQTVNDVNIKKNTHRVWVSKTQPKNTSNVAWNLLPYSWAWMNSEMTCLDLLFYVSKNCKDYSVSNKRNIGGWLNSFLEKLDKNAGERTLYIRSHMNEAYCVSFELGNICTASTAFALHFKLYTVRAPS